MHLRVVQGVKSRRVAVGPPRATHRLLRLGALPSPLARPLHDAGEIHHDFGEKQRKVGTLKQLPTEKASGGSEDRALPG